jgi:hypothetical protein
MDDSPMIFELRPRSAEGIYAVPYRSRRCGTAQRLPNGSIVERPTPAQRRQAPAQPDPFFEVAAGGGRATIHHANLGLIAGFLQLDGVYLLPSGEVAAVYGAEALPIG